MAGNHAQASPEGNPIADIEASLGSIWARYSGAGRPDGATVALEAGVVRWRLPQGMAELEDAMAATADLPVEDRRTPAGFRRDSIAAVAKATGRKVSAACRTKEAKTGAVTEAFILEVLPTKH